METAHTTTEDQATGTLVWVDWNREKLVAEGRLETCGFFWFRRKKSSATEYYQTVVFFQHTDPTLVHFYIKPTHAPRHTPLPGTRLNSVQCVTCHYGPLLIKLKNPAPSFMARPLECMHGTTGPNKAICLCCDWPVIPFFPGSRAKSARDQTAQPSKPRWSRETEITLACLTPNYPVHVPSLLGL